MQKLAPDDLYSLEKYAKIRDEFRRKVLEHKKNRQVRLGENATLYFEDRLTMQYQVQEMLRIERIFEEEGIAEELEAYNPLIPDGRNLKATFMIEFSDPEERRAQLRRLKGIEDRVWLAVDGFDRVPPVANEDLERTDETKTSAVHFVRFELDPKMIEALRNGADMKAGIDHENYWSEVAVPKPVRDSLAADLEDT